MKPRLLSVATAVIAAVVVLLAAGCTGKDAVDQTAGGQFRFVSGTGLGTTYPVADRKKAGDFTGQLLDGGTLTLSGDAGHVVVINFWATWCGPCTTEAPQFDSVYRSDKARGADFIGIDTKDIRNKAQAFVKDNNISYPIIFDEPGASAIALGEIPLISLPFTVLIDKQGRIAAVYLGQLSGKDLQPVLDKLVAET